MSNNYYVSWLERDDDGTQRLEYNGPFSRQEADADAAEQRQYAAVHELSVVQVPDSIRSASALEAYLMYGD